MAGGSDTITINNTEFTVGDVITITFTFFSEALTMSGNLHIGDITIPYYRRLDKGGGGYIGDDNPYEYTLTEAGTYDVYYVNNAYSMSSNVITITVTDNTVISGNDTSTLNGSLSELGELLATNLTTMGVNASADDGLTTLVNKVTNISTGSGIGNCYHINFEDDNYKATSTGNCTVSVYVQYQYEPLANATVTFTSPNSTTTTATTGSDGIATANITVSDSTTLTATTTNNTIATVSIIKSNIPYTQVEYLQANGSQYINTGYILKSGDKVDVTFSSQGQLSYEAVFGARKSSYRYNAYLFFSRFGSNNKAVYNRTGQEKQGNNISTNVVYDVHTDGSTCTVKQNGTTVQTITTTGTLNDCINPCGLFTLNTNSSTSFTKDTYSYMKIYYFKITDANDNVVMELIPVRDGTTANMYDTVSEQLMTKTGTFQYGDDV